MKRTQGFTIIELMITLAVAAILATIAAPSLTSMMDNGRAFQGANDLYNLLSFARGQAVTLQKSVVVCSWSSDDDDCSGSTSWKDQAVAFVDTNDDGAHDDDEPILKSVGPFDDRDTVYSNRSSYGFNAQGRSSGLNNGSILYCPRDADSSFNRRVSVAGSGRVSIAKKSSDTSVGDCQ